MNEGLDCLSFADTIIAIRAKMFWLVDVPALILHSSDLRIFLRTIPYRINSTGLMRNCEISNISNELLKQYRIKTNQISMFAVLFQIFTESQALYWI